MKKVNIGIVVGLIAGFLLWPQIQRGFVRYVMPAHYVVDYMIDKCNPVLAGKPVDEGLVIDSMTREGEKVYYCYTVDEEVLDMNCLDENRDVMKENISEDLGQLSGDEKIGFQKIADSDMLLIYCYVGNITGRTLELTFNAEDLKKIFQ